MSTTSTNTSKASTPTNQPQAESEEQTKAGNEDARDNHENSCENNSTDSLHGRSRYGRTIKFKSTNIANSPQNSLMPKIRRHQNSTDSNNESIHEDNVSSNADEASDISTNTMNYIGESSPLKGISTLECNWVAGHLAWARVGNFPFWPCIVTPDPSSMIYYKFLVRGKAHKTHVLMIHVQYFGDRGRHSWVSSKCMMEFTNLADFKKAAELATSDPKKKDPKYTAAFTVKQSTKSKWESAIEEALEVQLMTITERAKMFAPKVKASRSASSKTLIIDEKNKSSKRKNSNDQDGPDIKRIKQENTEKSPRKAEGTKSHEIEKPKSKKRFTINGKLDAKLNFEVRSSSPSSNKSQDDSSSNTKIDKNDEDEDGIFEIYYERNKDMLEDEYPAASEHDIKKYLRNTWDSMEPAFRKKYRTYMTRENSEHSKESSSDHDDEMSTGIDTNVKENKKAKNKVDKDESSVSETKRSRPHNLFKGMKQEKVCQICEKTGKLTRCKGPCYSYFHLPCVKPGESSPEHSADENTSEDKIIDDVNVIKRSISGGDDNVKMEEQEDEMFKCIDCLSGVAPACFICNEREGDRIRCSVMACGKHYHSMCLKSWPQSHWQGGRLTCPYHLCHTCSSDNPQDNHSRAPNEKIARCVRCPSSYHTSTLCLPAGSVILTGSQIVCPKHYKAPQPPANAAWCFLCTRGGSLICCDTCPTSFHLECLGIKAPDGGFFCEDCETGRLPLYGEIVWVKLGSYRWWPARICYPAEIPEKVEAIPHSPGTFCVMFLGSNDYYWVHRGRAFLYQDGDASIKPAIGKKSIMDDAYRKALEEANKIHLQLKEERSVTKEPKGLKPPPYVKLKVNKPVGNVKPVEVESIVACECDPAWDDPCAPGTDCLNRILLVECSPGICPAGSKCMNQSFVLRKYPAMEPFHTTGRGWGLKALEDIKTGQFVIEYVGEVIDEAEYKHRLHRKKELKNENFYFLTIDNNRTIDAEPKGNLSRFMNHSCAPNCETQKWTVNGDTRIGLFALRDIESGEELTFNYNLASDGETRKACLCGAPNCSGFIGLKAQKQQLPAVQSSVQPKSTPQPKKVEKALLHRKSDKRFRRSMKLTCWQCGQEISSSNEPLICQQRTCRKKYHRTCVTLDGTESKFSCPWHYCLECGRRTSTHCSFCSTAFCQVHHEGNLFEHSEKSGVVCKLHVNADVRKSVEGEKEYSDIDNETDREYSSTSSNSSIVMEKITTREPLPRVAIVEKLYLQRSRSKS
ncbi:PREDICTED: histone-lysine N-methyltransferase NSD2 isoform X2 [Dinoponera quadriceps]|uniref:Histone-lysine N-methyltransferase NSD2 isoform X2 n=1 Tax=Dinoponera quadriceps TaxID=609295 RepID=A0A6P3XNX6_DINQU|nr:PREDICTED: histone-lysine N-methyltransferase NSD2 isoform X2 [Dinoponera quadriceps]